MLCCDVDSLVSQWDQGKIIRFGWTADERLVVLNEEGVYRLYDLQSDYQQYSLGSEAAEMGIVDARIHENGLVALSGSLSLLEVKDWEGSRPLTLANPGLWVTPDSDATGLNRLQGCRSPHIHGLSFRQIRISRDTSKSYCQLRTRSLLSITLKTWTNAYLAVPSCAYPRRLMANCWLC
jgi:hypothetical protein